MKRLFYLLFLISNVCFGQTTLTNNNHVTVINKTMDFNSNTFLNFPTVTGGLQHVVAGYGLSNINDSTLKADSATLSGYYLRLKDSVAHGYYPYSSNPLGYLVTADISGKLNISDTSSMLSNYFNQYGYSLLRSGQTVLFDSATAANYFLRRKDSTTYYPYNSNPLGYLTSASISGKLNISDTAAMLQNYYNQHAYGLLNTGQIVRLDSATVYTYVRGLGYITTAVTSVATGYGLTGGTITTTGTLRSDTTAHATSSNTGYLSNTDWTTFNSKGSGTVTSIATSNGITGGTITGTGTISGINAAADGSTKGVASFTANDFDASTGNISIDYINGQSADGSRKGFLTSTDWTTFNNKQAALVSGTNIKTINGSSVLGSGDLTVSGSIAIGSAVTSATKGSIFFAGTSGILQQDNSHLYWDSTNHVLGIDTLTVAGNEALSVKGQGMFTDTLSINSHGRRSDAGSTGTLQLGDSYITKSYGSGWIITGGVNFYNQVVVNSSASPAGGLTIGAGTASANTAPIKLNAGTNLTSPEAGAIEYDGNTYFSTIETTAGRGITPSIQRFRLTSNGSNISTIANFFGSTSNITLVSGAEYIIEIDCYFTNSTAGTVTWTFTNSAAPTSQNIHARFSPVAGIVAPAGSAAATYLEGDVQGDATATKALTASGTLTNSTTQWAHFSIHLYNGTGTSLKIQATKSSGTITPLKGSYWTCTRVPASNTGTFAN